MRLVEIILAFMPVLAILVLMLGWRWRSARAGAAGWLIAVLVATLYFSLSLPALLWSHVQALFLALFVLYIIWGALLFYRVTESIGTLRAMGTLMPQLAPTRAAQLILLAWALTSFLQSVGGFGVPVAIVAPLMIGLGFSPIHAVVIPSLSDVWAVSFGSLGSSLYALSAATQLSESFLAPWSALHLGLLCFVTPLIAFWIAGGWPTLRDGLLPALLVATAMAGIQYLSASYRLENIASMLGSLAGLLVGSAWALLRYPEGRAALKDPSLVRRALLPYLLLLLIIFGPRFIGPLQALLDVVMLRVRLPALLLPGGRLQPAQSTRTISLFGHIGALLVYTSLIIFGVGRKQGLIERGAAREIGKKVARSGLSSTFAILAMVSVASIMDYAGMLQILSQAMADAAGTAFPLVAPFIGALGGFVTGSNTNSNVLFGMLQRNVAERLGYTVPLILAAQNAGGALGSMLSPAKVLVGCSTVEVENCEPEVMRILALGALPGMLLLALFTWALIFF